MELKFWMQFIVYLFAILFILFVVYICLALNEKKGKLAAGSVGILGCLIFVVIIAFFDGSEVISLKDGHYNTSKWIMMFKDGEKSFPIKSGKRYIYNAGEDTCNLILYPVYYTEDTKIIGTPVKDPVNQHDIEIYPGQITEFKWTPQYLFKSPKSFEVSNRHKVIYWYLDYRENVENDAPFYRKLRVEYDDYVDYY